MRMRRLVAGLLLSIASLGAPGVAAQQAPADEPLRVFIDCSYFCDMDFLRTEINWVSYMRDRADAQVHVLITRENTGGGGQQYVLNFIGLKEFATQSDTLRYVATSEATDDVRRRGLTKTIAMGLVPFAARTPYGQRLVIGLPQSTTATPGTAPGASVEQPRDPWNLWTFRVGTNGYLSGESRRSSGNYGVSLSANRVSEAWKISNSVRGDYSEDTYELPSIVGDTQVVYTEGKSVSRSYDADMLVVKSLGPHLSAGLRGSIGADTYSNTSLRADLGPAVEYNLFPYAESTRRQLTVQYSPSMRYFDYREVTLFGEVGETRPSHSLTVGYSTRQPWGSISMSASGSQYLHDTGKNRVNLYTSLSEIRLFRGFSLGAYASYSRVRDQLGIPAAELTPEQILLRQRELRTNYRYTVNFSLNYRFGSIFNSIVNPRFGGSGGGMIIFM